VSHALGRGKFLITTVDGIYDPKELKNFVGFAKRSPSEIVLGLTDFIDDEKPLRAQIDSKRRKLIALGPEAGDSQYVTAGLYWCSQKAVHYGFPEGREPQALREFLRALLKARVPMDSFLLGKVIDVDRPNDVIQAETYLQEIGLVQR